MLARRKILQGLLLTAALPWVPLRASAPARVSHYRIAEDDRLGFWSWPPGPIDFQFHLSMGKVDTLRIFTQHGEVSPDLYTVDEKGGFINITFDGVHPYWFNKRKDESINDYNNRIAFFRDLRQ